MRFTTYVGLLSAMQAFLLVDAEGINCKGSASCAGRDSAFGGTPIEELISSLGKNLEDNVMYSGDGRHLACAAGGLCAFLQGTNGQSVKQWAGKDLKSMLKALKEHNCKTCGSVPVGFLTEGVNDVHAAGMLTANFVHGGEDHLYQCDDHWSTTGTVELLEGPDSKRWIDAVLWKMNQDQVWTKNYPVNVPISCVGAVDSALMVRGSICAIPRDIVGSSMSGEQARAIAYQIRDNTSCGYGAQFAADDAQVLSLRGYLGIELIQDSCPAGSQTSH